MLNFLSKRLNLRPINTAALAIKSNIKNPAITAQPHFWLSPNFRLVNRISESVERTDSDRPLPDSRRVDFEFFDFLHGWNK